MFDSLPRTDSPLAILIAADWYCERGDAIAEAWLRADGTLPPRVTSLEGEGGGAGGGGGFPRGSGIGYGGGGGRGDGDGSGAGRGHGYGRGDGHGRGHGGGHGGGYGGYGRGDGSGECRGRGGGSGSGSSDDYAYGSLGRGDAGRPNTHWQETPMPDLGQYVIVRSKDQGCVCGEYRGHTGREVVLTQARQMFSWDGERLTMFDVATVPGDLRISRTVTDPAGVLLLEACGIIPVTPEVENRLRTAAAG